MRFALLGSRAHAPRGEDNSLWREWPGSAGTSARVACEPTSIITCHVRHNYISRPGLLPHLHPGLQQISIQQRHNCNRKLVALTWTFYGSVANFIINYTNCGAFVAGSVIALNCSRRISKESYRGWLMVLRSFGLEFRDSGTNIWFGLISCDFV